MRALQRQLILGVDEAGYGPNIGPLVIACSAWIVNETGSSKGEAAETMLERLAPAFLPKPIQSSTKHIPLGDSKAIYASGSSVAGLTLGVRYWMKQIGIETHDFDGVLDTIVPEFVASTAILPWYQRLQNRQSLNEQLRNLEELVPASLNASALNVYKAAGLEFLGVSATAIDEKKFNQDVERLGNKASLLSQASLRLAVGCLEKYVARPTLSIDSIRVYCDKHGGRNRYQALLMDAMPDVWFDVKAEATSRSDYRARWQDYPMNWCFLAKGDRLFASAFASMTAKWLREGLMARLNGFWQSQLPNVKSTAGYPVDAKRFRAEVEPIASQLGFPLADWWRFR